MKACLILHNMIVEERRDSVESFSGGFDGVHLFERFGLPTTASLATVVQHCREAGDFLPTPTAPVLNFEFGDEVRDPYGHLQLRYDLIQHIGRLHNLIE